MKWTRSLALLAAALPACSATNDRDDAGDGSPTGDCEAPGSGAHMFYSSPGPTDEWLVDCENPLEREYYRVFRQESGLAYVIPRPDGAKELALPCSDPTHALRDLVEEYLLCDLADDEADLARINAIVPADALVLTHFMHEHLVFEAEAGRSAILVTPFPLPADVLDACELHPDRASSDFVADCAAYRDSLMRDLAPPDFRRTAPELAALLNELYGIEP